MNLPNFLIIGAMKAGTTALYHYLEQHPQIYMSPVKETDFFLRDQNIEEYTSFFQGVSNEKAIGEASPGYLARSKAYERIAHYLPDIKLIAILRNPVNRAYSYFLMRYRRELHSMNEDEIMNYFTQIIYKDRLLIQEGFYYKYLNLYLNFFERNQLKICFYENLQHTPDILMRDIFQFLGVDEKYKITNYNTYYNKGGITKNQFIYSLLNNFKEYFNVFFKGVLPEEINQKLYYIYNHIRNTNLTSSPTLREEIRQKLIKIYHDDILHLEELIHQDLSTWLK